MKIEQLHVFYQKLCLIVVFVRYCPVYNCTSPISILTRSGIEESLEVFGTKVAQKPFKEGKCILEHCSCNEYMGLKCLL